MAAMSQAHALISLYKKLYEQRHREKPTVNTHSVKWGLQDMISDYGYKRSQDILTFYLETERPAHPIDYLLYNYHKINQLMLDKAEDEANRIRLRAETKRRVEEWDRIHGNS